MGLKSSRLRTRVGAALFGLLVGVLATPHAQDDVRRGATTGITGLSGCGASTTVVLGNATCSGTPTLASATISTTALATTTTDGVVLQNTTVSTSGVQVQYSPRVRFTGHAWNTTATAADNYLEMIQELRPASAATPTSTLAFGFRRSTDGSTGSFVDALTVTSAGAGTFTASVIAPLHTATGGTITTSAPLFAGTETWNASGVSFIGSTLTFTETASAAGSRYFQILGGASGTTDEMYLSKGGSLTINGSFASGGNVVATNDVAMGAADQLRWSTNRSRMLSPSDGVIGLYDSALGTFARLQFGGTTSSFPAAKRFGNAIALRAADDTVPTFSTLTACSSAGEGALAAVSDSTTNTWGATITGTGSNHVLAYCDGTNWTVAGK